MTMLARLLAASPHSIVLPALLDGGAPILRTAGLPRMDVSGVAELGRSDLNGLIVADWQRVVRLRKK
jgi:hypothetical protein